MATNGGARVGGGRRAGSVQKVTQRARDEAKALGLLPHEWLLKVSRGEPIPQKTWIIKRDKQGKEVSRVLHEEDYYATFPDRIDCAKAAAPYYAPKLAIQHVSVTDGSTGSAVAEALRAIATKLPV